MKLIFSIGRVVSLPVARVLLAFLLSWNDCSSNLTVASPQIKTEWILVQKQVDTGELIVFVSLNAVKIVSKKFQYQLLAKAPDWRVHCFRPAEKVEWTGSLDRFDGVMLANPFSVPSKKSSALSVLRPGAMLGLTCTKYLELPDKRAVIWAADDICIAPKGAEFMCRYYFVPQISKIPLRRVRDIAVGGPVKKTAFPWMELSMGKDLRSGIQVYLNTESCMQVPFKSSDFDYPIGYQQVNQIERVSYSRKMKDDLEILGDDIGFTTHTGSSKTTRRGTK